MSEEFKNESPIVNHQRKAGRPKKEFNTDKVNTVAELLEEKIVRENTQETKRELTATEKAELRTKKKAERVAAIKDRELLSLSPEQLTDLKKKGLVPKLAKAENVNDWKAKGYWILENPEHHSSDQVYSGKSSSGGIEIQDNKTDPSSKSVWMVTDEENRDILREIEIDKSERQMSSIGTGRAVDQNGQAVNLAVGGKLTRS